VLLIMAFVAALALLGVNVKTTLAGLGIGGLAIALGAQKTLENIIGGVSLLMDKVVHAGDFCEIGGKLGTVEDIGLRSIRLRTLDQNLLVVPNSLLAQMQFQNMKGAPRGRPSRRRFGAIVRRSPNRHLTHLIKVLWIDVAEGALANWECARRDWWPTNRN